MRVGITGHQRLEDSAAWDWVQEQIESVLLELPRPLMGLTSLAMGADQLFAKAVLKQGDSFKAIIPFNGYETKFSPGPERDGYTRLLKQAAEVEVLNKFGSGREAYFQAGKQVVHVSELLLAVWNSLPAAGLGGTGDVVRHAESLGKPITHINPITHTLCHTNQEVRSRYDPGD